MSRPTPQTFKTGNRPACNEALKRRGSLTIYFNPSISWEAALTCKRGRQAANADVATQPCLKLKIPFAIAPHETTVFVESLLPLVGLGLAVPDFGILSRRQKSLKVDIPCRRLHGPLHPLIDYTGNKVEWESEWNARKHGGANRRFWRKVHIGIDERFLEIRAADFTTSGVVNALMPPEQLDQISHEQEIARVTTVRVAAAIKLTFKNAKPWMPGTAGAVAGNELLRT